MAPFQTTVQSVVFIFLAMMLSAVIGVFIGVFIGIGMRQEARKSEPLNQPPLVQFGSTPTM